MTNKVSYSPLQQMSFSDDEDDPSDDHILFDRNVNATGFSGKKRKGELYEMDDLGTGHWPRGREPHVEVYGKSRKTCLILSAFIVIIGGSVAAVLLPFLNSRNQFIAHWKVARPDWIIRLPETATESGVRLVDLNGDGLDDILIGYTTAINLQATENVQSSGKTIRQICRSINTTYPCLQDLVAYRGFDGKEIWRTKARSSTIFMNCKEIDVNKDGKMDCIVTGRHATVQAVDSQTGNILWVTEPEVKPWSNSFNSFWNCYQALALPDFTRDGVQEILIAHGGDPKIEPEDHNRTAGRLVILNGATGRPIGTYLAMPDSRETYMSPVLFTAPDNSQFVLFGSGGETVSGDFMAISVPDLYRIVRNYPMESPVPGVSLPGKYQMWKKMNRKNGIITIYRGRTKGVMVPPLLIDMTKDGIDDILVSAFEGFVILYDGKDLEEIWRAKFPNKESYSSPAPGYFDDDEYIDFMMHWSNGAWPHYNSTTTVVLSGKNGSTLWQTTTTGNEMSSDLVLRTHDKHSDKFITQVIGRKGGYSASKKIMGHGLQQQTKPNKMIRKRHLGGGSHDEDMEDDKFDEMSAQDRQQLCDDSGNDYRKDHMSCEQDLENLKDETLFIDRHLGYHPLKLLEVKAEKHQYAITVEEGRHYCHTPPPGSKKIDMCVVLSPDVRGTGAIGDVDGDGQPDLVNMGMVMGNRITDRYSFDGMVSHIILSKTNIMAALEKHQQVAFNVSMATKSDPTKPKTGVDKLQFLPMEQQWWLEYFGTAPYGSYREP